MEREINQWFANYREEYGPDDMVQAAENCAVELDHDEWLDDENHILWGIAFDWFKD